MAMPRKYDTEAQRKAARLEAQRLRRVKPIEADSSKMKPIDEEVKPIEAASAGGTSDPPSCFVHFRHCPHVPLSLFDGHGRGTVRTHSDGRRYVMVARHDGPDLGELGIVTAADWQARLGQRCGHGFAGWQCHAC